MKKMLKVTFGTMIAVGMAASGSAFAAKDTAPAPADEQAEHAHHHHHHGHHHHHHHGHHHHHHYDPLNNVAAWVEGTYTKPSNNALSVGDLLLATSPGNFDGGRRHTFLEPDMEWDYAVGLTYRMPHTHSRLFFSYDHYENDDDTKGDIDVRNIGLQPAPQTNGVASVDLHSNEFRLGVIHDLHFGDHFCLDLLAFFEYDKVRQTTEEFNSANGITNSRETENKVKGFGPGVGFMTRWYAHNPHWHIFAGANTIMVATDNDYSTSFTGATVGGVNTFYLYEPEESHSLVGKIDINFGINYRCAFRHEMHGIAWDVSLGMRYMNMFNAFKNGNTAWQPDARLQGNGAFGPAAFAANLGPAQDWGRYGPFLKFKLGGAHS